MPLDILMCHPSSDLVFIYEENEQTADKVDYSSCRHRQWPFFFFPLYFDIGIVKQGKGFPQLVTATLILQCCLSLKVHQ